MKEGQGIFNSTLWSGHKAPAQELRLCCEFWSKHLNTKHIIWLRWHTYKAWIQNGVFAFERLFLNRYKKLRASSQQATWTFTSLTLPFLNFVLGRSQASRCLFLTLCLHVHKPHAAFFWLCCAYTFTSLTLPFLHFVLARSQVSRCRFLTLSLPHTHSLKLWLCSDCWLRMFALSGSITNYFFSPSAKSIDLIVDKK